MCSNNLVIHISVPHASLHIYHAGISANLNLPTPLTPSIRSICSAPLHPMGHVLYYFPKKFLSYLFNKALGDQVYFDISLPNGVYIIYIVHKFQLIIISCKFSLFPTASVTTEVDQFCIQVLKPYYWCCITYFRPWINSIERKEEKNNKQKILCLKNM